MKTKTLLFTALTLLLSFQITNAQIGIYGVPEKIEHDPLDPIQYSDWEIITHTGTQSDFTAIHFSDNNHGWVVSENGIMIYTQDGGLTWEEEYFGPSLQLKDVYFIDSDNGFIVGSIDVGPLTKGVIYRTSNSGETWNLKYISESQAHINQISFSNAQDGFANGNTLTPIGSEGLTLVTLDSGETWEELTKQPPGLQFTNIQFTNENDAWAVGTIEVGPSEASIVLNSEDGGRTWNTSFFSTGGVSLHDISFSDANNGFVIGEQGSILKTKDAGTNWSAQNFRQYSFNAVLAGNNESGWVIGDEGAILSTYNNGSNWVQEITLLETNLNAICSSPNGYVWVVGDEGTLYKYTPNSINPPNNSEPDADNSADKTSGVTDDGFNQNDVKETGPLVRHKNFPNPFADKTTISFELETEVYVRLDVYNISGKLITTLKDQHLEVGTHEVVFDATDLAPGIYTYILSAGNYFENGKMIVR